MIQHNLKTLQHHFNLELVNSNYELKYSFQEENFSLVYEWLTKHLVHTNQYETESVYFDNKDMTLYTDHLDSELNRFKFRLRWYNKLQKGKIEVKQRHGLQHLKWNASLDFSEKCLEDFRANCFMHGLIPYLKNAYTRSRFFHSKLETEITLDSNIRFEKCLGELSLGHLEAGSHLRKVYIMEVKGKSFEYCHQLSRQLPIAGPVTLSKYMLGVNFFKDRIWNY